MIKHANQFRIYNIHLNELYSEMIREYWRLHFPTFKATVARKMVNYQKTAKKQLKDGCTEHFEKYTFTHVEHTNTDYHYFVWKQSAVYDEVIVLINEMERYNAWQDKLFNDMKEIALNSKLGRIGELTPVAAKTEMWPVGVFDFMLRQDDDNHHSTV